MPVERHTFSVVQADPPRMAVLGNRGTQKLKDSPRPPQAPQSFAKRPPKGVGQRRIQQNQPVTFQPTAAKPVEHISKVKLEQPKDGKRKLQWALQWACLQSPSYTLTLHFSSCIRVYLFHQAIRETRNGRPLKAELTLSVVAPVGVSDPWCFQLPSCYSDTCSE
jgi:hypothetical protein